MRAFIGDMFLGLRGTVRTLLLRNSLHRVCVSAEGHVHVDAYTGEYIALLQTPVTAAADAGK